MRTVRTVLLISTIAVAATPVVAQSHPAGRLCSDRYVYTGTVLGQIQMRHSAGNLLRPELTQAAAFWALVEEQQRHTVRVVIEQRMRALNKWGGVEDNLWPLVSDDALDAVRKAELGRAGGRVAAGGVLVGALGGVLGAAVTGRADGIVQGAKSGAKLGAGAGAGLSMPTLSPGKLTFNIVVGKPLERALDHLVRNPCTVTAEEALQLVIKR